MRAIDQLSEFLSGTQAATFSRIRDKNEDQRLFVPADQTI
jgi:hypothetical protein